MRDEADDGKIMASTNAINKKTRINKKENERNVLQIEMNVLTNTRREKKNKIPNRINKF